MLTDGVLKNLLSEYQVGSELKESFRDNLRKPIEDAINAFFPVKPHYRYGGSLAKGTANSNSCDVDLLVYFDSDYEMSVSDIYDMVVSALNDVGYLLRPKNSAICLYGKRQESWGDITVDVVPGKYSTGGDDKDVYLCCHKDGSRLKSNPEKQIGKIQESDMKQVIRLIKLLRATHGFYFKSFMLELFAVDVVEPHVGQDSSLVEKLMQFAMRFTEIGVTKVYDPANPNGNNIMGIHSEAEFLSIRQYIRTLYEVLLTDDENLVISYLTDKKSGSDINGRIQGTYAKSAKSHSPSLQLPIGYSGSPTLSLACRTKRDSEVVLSGQTIGKNVYLRFEVPISSYYSGYKFRFIVSNAGYEARAANQLRGKAEEPDAKLSTSTKYVREEHTLYNGNHYVQVIGTHPFKGTLYSLPFVVCVRDF